MSKSLTPEQVTRDLGQMEANLSVRQTKYIRNYNRYVNNGSLKDQINNIDTNPPQGFWWNSSQPDTGPIPMLNVLRSQIDTICSKLAQTKVRPFFNPVNGTWETRKVCRGALQFFDLYFDNQHLFKKAILARRDSLIFEIGNVWVNEDDGTVERIMPWDFLFDRAELHYGAFTRVAVRRKTYPIAYLADKDWIPSEWKRKIDENRIKKVELTMYYDLAGGKKTYLIDQKVVAEKKIDFECSPVVYTFYSPPVKGAFSTSLIDNQYTSQTLVDTIAERLELAVELSPANFIMLPSGAGLKRSTFTNETGAVYEYEPNPYAANGPTVVTPSPISPEYLEILKYTIESMYNLEGVSQLSAQSVKPTGLNSGVALQTIQNIESERFETLLDDQTEFMMNITNTCIEVFPKEATLLPKQAGRASINWKDVKEQREMFSVQFAPVSALSKDPQTKMEQVEKLIGMKVISPENAPVYLEFPDIEREQSNATAVNDVIEHVIERAIDDGEYEYDLVIPGQMLEQSVLRELFRLDAIDEDKKVIDRIRAFYNIVRQNNNNMQQAMNPPTPPQPPPEQPIQPPTAPGPTNQLPMEAPQGAPAPGPMPPQNGQSPVPVQ